MLTLAGLLSAERKRLFSALVQYGRRVSSIRE